MRPDRPRFLRIPLLLIVVPLLVPACGPVPAAEDEGEQTSAELRRFDVRSVAMRRGPPVLLRVDTATGETWRMGLMDANDAAWLGMRETAGSEPEPGAPERYDVRAITLRRGAPTLVRTDTVSGKSWRKGLMSGGPWVPITSVVEPEPLPEVGLPDVPAPPVDAPAGADPATGESDAAAGGAAADDAAIRATLEVPGEVAP